MQVGGGDVHGDLRRIIINPDMKVKVKVASDT
jgi:hypothetical protein